VGLKEPAELLHQRDLWSTSTYNPC